MSGVKAGDGVTPGGKADPLHKEEEVKHEIPLDDPPTAIPAQQPPIQAFDAQAYNPRVEPPATGAYAYSGPPVLGQPVSQMTIPVYALGEHEQRLLTTYSLSRGIRILAIVDAVILLVNIISFGVFGPYGPLSLISAWGPFAGFFAAQNFNPCLAWTYLAYYFIRISFDVFALTRGLWWFVISIMIDIFIARFVWAYAVLLKAATPEELNLLRNPEQAQAAVAPRASPYFVYF